jgi:transporter family-2 protein
MDRLLALIATLVVGGLVAAQPPANAMLAKHVGDLGAAFTSLLLSTLIVGTLLVVAGDVPKLRGLGEYELQHSLGAISGAAIVLVSLITVRHLGASGVAAVLVVSQLVVAAILDKLGVLGLEEAGLSAERLIGIALLIAGTILVTAR